MDKIYRCYGDIVNKKLVVREYEVLNTIEREPPIYETAYGPMEAHSVSDSPEQAIAAYKLQLGAQLTEADKGIDAAKEIKRKLKHKARMVHTTPEFAIHK